jgi:hypothetical protein
MNNSDYLLELQKDFRNNSDYLLEFQNDFRYEIADISVQPSNVNLKTHSHDMRFVTSKFLYNIR